MALRSYASQSLQEANNLQVAMLSSDFMNTSSLEETKIMNRFSIAIGVTALHTKIKVPPYFDGFSGEFLENGMMQPVSYDPETLPTT